MAKLDKAMSLGRYQEHNERIKRKNDLKDLQLNRDQVPKFLGFFFYHNSNLLYNYPDAETTMNNRPAYIQIILPVEECSSQVAFVRLSSILFGSHLVMGFFPAGWNYLSVRSLPTLTISFRTNSPGCT